MEKRVSDLLPARRDSSGSEATASSAHSPTRRSGPSKRARPESRSARMRPLRDRDRTGRRISHIDSFDFKEGEGTPRIWTFARCATICTSRGNCFRSSPRRWTRSPSSALCAVMRCALPRPILHAGRATFESAQAPEIPSIGSVVSYEMEQFRRETDTFPTYIGCNLDTSGCGALSTGFLPPRHSVLDIDLKAGGGANAVEGEALALLQERYRLLGNWTKPWLPRAGRDRSFSGFRSFQESAYQILGDSAGQGLSDERRGKAALRR